MKYIEKHPMVMIIVGILGISVSAVSVRYSTASSVVTAAYRLWWTVLLMSPVVWGRKSIRRELLFVDRKSFFISVISGIFLALHFTWWFESLFHTTVASSTVIVCTEVIWVALGFCIFLKGKLSKKAVIAILITVLGSILVAWSDSMALGGAKQIYGDFLSLIAAIAVAVYTLLGRIAREKISTTVYTYIVYVSCGIALLVMALAGKEDIFAFEKNAVIVGLVLAVCCTLLGHSLFSWSLKYFSPAFVSASKLCEPAVSTVLALILFGEVPGLLQIIGGCTIIGGVVYYSKIEE